MNPPYGMEVEPDPSLGGHRRRPGLLAAGGRRRRHAGGGPDGQAALPDPGRHLGLDGPGRGPGPRPTATARASTPAATSTATPASTTARCSRPRRRCATPWRRSGRCEFALARYHQDELGQTCGTAPSARRWASGPTSAWAGAAGSTSDRTRPTTTSAAVGTGLRPLRRSRQRSDARLLQRLDLLPGRRAHRRRLRAGGRRGGAVPGGGHQPAPAGQLDRRAGGLPHRHQQGAARLGHHAHRRRAERRPRLDGQRRQHASAPGAGIAQPRRPRRPAGRTTSS